MNSNQKEKPLNFVNEDLLKSVPFVYERLISVSKSGIHRRTYFHWKKLELLPDYNDSAREDDVKRRPKLNFVEFLWVKCIQSLRNLGVGLVQIKNLKDFLFTEFDKRLLNEQLENIKTAQINHAEDATAQIQNAIRFIDHFPADKKIFLTLFGSLVSMAYLSKKPVSLLLFPEKSEQDSVKLGVFIRGGSADELAPDLDEEIQKLPHIVLPLRSLIVDFLKDEEYSLFSKKFGFISKEEDLLLETFKKRDFKKMVVTFDDKNDLVIDVTKVSEVKDNEAANLRKILGMKEYKRIELTQRNDKHIYIENMQRIKMTR